MLTCNTISSAFSDLLLRLFQNIFAGVPMVVLVWLVMVLFCFFCLGPPCVDSYWVCVSLLVVFFCLLLGSDISGFIPILSSPFLYSITSR